MPRNHIVRRVKVGGGLVINKVVAINKYRPPPAITEIVQTDYNKPVETAATATATTTQTKKTTTKQDNQVTKQPTAPIPAAAPAPLTNIVKYDDSKSKATRAQVLKAINQALIGKPRKVGQRGGFLKMLK